MNCRGHETRQRIVRDFEVQPKAHIKLLANQQKHSDAGATIEDEYYVFIAESKIDGKKEVIQCCMGAARDFLELINHKGLPLFVVSRKPLAMLVVPQSFQRGNKKNLLK